MNLTSLANVRQWLSIASGTTDDAFCTRLIAEASRMILNYTQRADFGLTSINEVISGRGELKIQLRNWPVVTVASLSINGVTIPPSTTPTAFGWFLEPVYGSTAGRIQNLGIANFGCGNIPTVGSFPNGMGVTAVMPSPASAYGRPFPPGVGNIIVGYSFGYCVQNEAQIIPATPYQIVPNAPYGAWSQDNGVTFASNGVALTPTTGTPSAGQYVPPNLNGDNPTLTYLFAAADTGKGVLINYNYVPYDVEQACIEIVGERYKYRGRIGQSSQSMGGQTSTAYMVRDAMTASIKGRLDPYKLSWGG